jgi:hypothetical protein
MEVSAASLQPRRTSIATLVSTGACIGAIGMVLFGTAHALLVTPIWDRLFAGILFAIGSGIAIVWLYARVASSSTRHWLGVGLRFGLVLWSLLLPANLLAVVIRIAGFHNAADDTWEVAAGLTITGCVAALWAFRRRQSISLAVKAAMALVIVFATMGGPVNVTRSPWATALLFAFIPIYVVAGVIAAGTLHRFGTR